MRIFVGFPFEMIWPGQGPMPSRRCWDVVHCRWFPPFHKLPRLGFKMFGMGMPLSCLARMQDARRAPASFRECGCAGCLLALALESLG